MRHRRWAAAALVALLVAGAAPLAASPRARTIRIPRTLAAAVENAPRAVSLRFPATHVVFEWSGPRRSALDYRTIGPDGVRSAWTEAGIDDFDAETRRHVTGVLAIRRAVGLEWRNTGGPVEDVRIDYMNTLDGPAVERRVPLTARAGATPAVVSRAEWGADESITRKSGSCAREFAPVQQLFVHHTAGSNSATQDSAATMRAILHYHVKTNGWCDIGYNFVIGRDGRIYEGRWSRTHAPGETPTGEDDLGRGVVGAHVAGYNTGSVGVSLMGNFETQALPATMRSALVDFLAWKAERHGLDPTGKHTFRNGTSSRELHYIAGHRDAGSTACPGAYVYADLPKIRRDVKARMTNRTSVTISLRSDRSRIDYGGSVTLSGLLTDASGLPLPGRELAVYRRGADAWKVKKRLTTGADGSFSLTVRPTAEVSYRADFAGDEALRPGKSAVRTIAVRHVVAAFVEGGRSGDGAYTRFPPDTTSVVLYGWGLPKHQAEIRIRLFRVFTDGTQRRVRIDGTPLLSGEWQLAVPVRTPGRYKAVARFNADDRHLLGKSDPVRFRVRRG
ncbi:MAG TPA: peptidoglycan recognition protein [Actinomycetota bacterium]|nr:peptidoglycan recognition protein [Actinomycetota bacterium]